MQLEDYHRGETMAEVAFTANSSVVGDLSILPSFPMWQLLAILGVISWMYLARLLLITVRLRSIVQPFVIKHVQHSIPVMLRIQSFHSPTLDAVLASMSYCVSVEFYTGFLPLLFWSGHSRLARHMTLLMAFCLYLGNCVKDIVSAPRPPSPPIRKLLATGSEKDSALEYGLPSSHTINTLCLLGYLLHYIGSRWGERDALTFWLIASVFALFIFGVIYGRLYLGMHSPIDIIAGVGMGFGILSMWTLLEDHVEAFIAHGDNVISFWTTMAILVLLAYPTPEQRNPSYEFHTAFNGVALGVVCGIHRTYGLYHDESARALSFTTFAGTTQLLIRLLVGLPICLAVKAASKALAIRLLPSFCNLLGVQIQSSGYVKAVHVQEMSLKINNKDTNGEIILDARKGNYLLKILQGFEDEVLDVDTGIRLLQYAGLGWSVVELAPSIYAYFNL